MARQVPLGQRAALSPSPVAPLTARTNPQIHGASGPTQCRPKQSCDLNRGPASRTVPAPGSSTARSPTHSGLASGLELKVAVPLQGAGGEMVAASGRFAGPDISKPPPVREVAEAYRLLRMP